MRFRKKDNLFIANRIDSILPQTQCGKCDFPACRPYANAIAAGSADINQCPPGGAKTIKALADLLGRAPKPLNPKNGIEKPKTVVFIDEQNCIGCTLCIQACPVDAILGAAKQMHTILAQECTGCDLCIPPCPVDCIEIRDAICIDTEIKYGSREYIDHSHIPLAPYYRFAKSETTKQLQENNAANIARHRYEQRQHRLLQEKSERDTRYQKKVDELNTLKHKKTVMAIDKKLIMAAVKRTQLKRAKIQQSKIFGAPQYQK